MASSGGTAACLGQWKVRREVRRVEEMSHHLLGELGVGLAGQGNVVKVSSASPLCIYDFSFFFLFLTHMFIVSTVQEMTCIVNDMAKTKPKIKLTKNKRKKHNQFPQRDQ